MVLYQFMILNHSVESLVEDNYKTIKACKGMLEALEREDSGILMLSMGNWKEGREILMLADSTFMAEMTIAKGNITEDNEDGYVQAVSDAYEAFRSRWKRPIVGTDKERNMVWYSDEVNPSFVETKQAVNALMVLNQESMYNEATKIKEQSYRAIMPGIVAIVAIIVFAFIFNFFLSQALLVPLKKLIKTCKDFKPNMTGFHAKIKNNDEFAELEDGIKTVIERLREFNKTDR